MMGARIYVRMAILAMVLLAALIWWPKGTPRVGVREVPRPPRALPPGIKAPVFPKEASGDQPNFNAPTAQKTQDAIQLESEQSEFELNGVMQDTVSRLGDKLDDAYCGENKGCCSYSDQSSLQQSRNESWFVTNFECHLGTDTETLYYANYHTYVARKDGEWTVLGDSLTMIKAQEE
jgi:hypothetical protein